MLLLNAHKSGRHRNKFIGDEEAVVVGMTSNGFILADPNDRGTLDVVGFDTSVPAVIAVFAREGRTVRDARRQQGGPKSGAQEIFQRAGGSIPSPQGRGTG